MVGGGYRLANEYFVLAGNDCRRGGHTTYLEEIT
jgi:hypothetical protein